MLLTKKQRKKEIARKQYPDPYRGRGNSSSDKTDANVSVPVHHAVTLVGCGVV